MALCRTLLSQGSTCCRLLFVQHARRQCLVVRTPHVRNLQTVIRRMETTEASSSTSKKLSGRERLKQMVKEYGAVVMVIHVSLSLTSLGLFYLAVKYGVDMSKLTDYFGVKQKSAATASTFAVAYVAHKSLAPVRIGITLGITPPVVMYLRRVGMLKGSAAAAAAAKSVKNGSSPSPKL